MGPAKELVRTRRIWEMDEAEEEGEEEEKDQKIKTEDEPKSRVIREPQLQTPFQDRDDLNKVVDAYPLQFGPNMDTVLGGEHPSGIDFFRTLPAAAGQKWAVYAVLMEKAGERPALYIGSATNCQYGIGSRASHYVPGGRYLPRFVRIHFERGFHMSHIGLLCWAPPSSPERAPRQRALLLDIEAIFTAVFHAKFKWKNDNLYEHVVLWPRKRRGSRWRSRGRVKNSGEDTPSNLPPTWTLSWGAWIHPLPHRHALKSLRPRGKQSGSFA